MSSEQMQETAVPRYPKCRVTLLGTSTHAVSIITKTRRALELYLREQGMTPQEIRLITQEFTDEATSGGYDNVLTTAFRWVDVN